jgi:hypothetical protein
VGAAIGKIRLKSLERVRNEADFDEDGRRVEENSREFRQSGKTDLVQQKGRREREREREGGEREKMERRS